MVIFWYYIVMTLKQLIVMCSIIIAFGIGNNLAHTSFHRVYDWTWVDSIGPFIPIIILAVVWFVKNHNEHNS